MDSFNFHKLQAEKTNAILKPRQLRKIANLIRYVEICVVLILISRISFQLPVAVKNSSEYFRGFMVSPAFVFLVGNAIIITLFAQWGQFSAQGSARADEEFDIYQEFIRNSTEDRIIQTEQKKFREKQSIGTEEKQSIRTEEGLKSGRIDGYLIKYPENQSIKRITKMEDKRIEGRKIKWAEKQSTKTKTGDTNISLEVKDYRRCQTENIRLEKPRRVLQRSETENRIEPERVGRTSYPEDGMTNEEFRRTIEAFIARQQSRRTQEKCSYNLHYNPSSYHYHHHCILLSRRI